MISKIKTVSFQGIDIIPITVEVSITNGLPQFNIVGLADKSVAESKERIRSSFYAMGLNLPAKRITVNLSPADCPKEGTHYDLPIILGILTSIAMIDPIELESYVCMGELSLDGSLLRSPGILPASIYAHSHQKGIICPFSCGSEAAWTGIEKVIAAHSVIDIINHFKGIHILSNPEPTQLQNQNDFLDFSDVKGQAFAKRGMVIAAIGGHHALLNGVPGSGKSMIAKRLSSILSPLTPQEALEVSTIYSVSGLLPESGFITRRTFRDPHHSISTPALVGGGSKAKPGEISLAHHGVLFMDELPEFSKFSLEALRQPLESGEVLIARANHRSRFPARFQLIAAMNPCKCGFLGEQEKECTKAPLCGGEYQKKLSGPLLDRFDLFIPISKVSFAELLPQKELTAPHQNSENMRHIVLSTLEFQQNIRNQHFKNNLLNGSELMHQMCETPELKKRIETALKRFNLTTRSLFKILRVSRTVADIEHSLDIQDHHLLEAFQFRQI